MGSRAISLEQQSRELGDQRRKMAGLVDKASSFSEKIIELAARRESCLPQDQDSLDEQLCTVIADHLEVVDEIALQSTRSDAMEQAMSERIRFAS